ncbi:MAG: DUF1697 domain-containing protein [Verrucomicrobiota bacterium]
MHRFVALLRGINLGRRRVKMDQLRSLFQELGLANVSTFIASGNVLFETKTTKPAQLEAAIEAHLFQSLGYEVDTYLRDSREVAAAAGRQPFQSRSPGGGIYLIFLRKPLDPATENKLIAVKTEIDAFAVVGREIYWSCRTRMSDSVVWSLPEVKALKLPAGTMRNMTTVQKLAALLNDA